MVGFIELAVQICVGLVEKLGWYVLVGCAQRKWFRLREEWVATAPDLSIRAVPSPGQVVICCAMAADSPEAGEVKTRLRQGVEGAQQDLYDLLQPLAALRPRFVDVADFQNELYLRVLTQVLRTGAGTTLPEIHDLTAYAKGVALNLRRTLQQRRRAAPRALAWDPEDDDPTDESSRQMDLAEVVISAISRLPRKDREVLWLMDCERLEATQVAAMLTKQGRRSTEAAVYSRLARARRALHMGLVRQGYRPSVAARWLGLEVSPPLATVLVWLMISVL